MTQEGFVRTGAGRVHYVRDGQGPGLLLLHSNGNSLHEYDAVRERLASDFDLILWDMPGQGDSDPLSRHLSIDDYGDAVVDLLNDLDIPGAFVMGASVGGCIAASLGARHGDRLTGVGIIESQFRPAAWWADGWLGIERLFSTPLQTLDQVRARFHGAPPELVERVNLDRHKAGGRAMMSAMWAIREFDMMAAVPAITTPALLLFGTAGPTIETAPLMHAALPGASYEVIEGAGHFPMVDHPDEFVTVVRRFAAGVA
ncbi:MAG: alpha/beta fold hydrolase [Nitriliruptorales bacterium]|nr:alpha/beta fold hydrolase [Nitriliruptorales bacterium]